MSNTPSLSVDWQQPTFLLPLFGLCPLLGATDSLATAIGMSVLVSITTLLATPLNSLLIPRFAHNSLLLHIATSITLTTSITLLTHAYAYALYVKLGLYLSLTISMPLLLAHQKLHSHSLGAAVKKAALMSIGFTLAALVLGSGRELVGHGSLFTNAGVLLGAWAQPLETQFYAVELGFVLAILAPGAFVALGLGIALYNWLALSRQRAKSNSSL